MVQFETIKAEEIKFGNGKFLEIARKKAISETGENVFISMSSGIFMQDGKKQYRKNFTVPTDEAVLDFIVHNLKKV